LGIKIVSILPNIFVPNGVFSYAAEPFLDHQFMTMSVTTHFPGNFILYIFILDIFKMSIFKKLAYFFFGLFGDFSVRRSLVFLFSIIRIVVYLKIRNAKVRRDNQVKFLGIFWDKNISILPNKFVPKGVFSYAVEPFLDHQFMTMSVTTHFPENSISYIFILDIFKMSIFKKLAYFFFGISHIKFHFQ